MATFAQCSQRGQERVLRLQYNGRLSRMKGQWLFVVVSLCPLIAAQSPLVITVAVRTCPTSSQPSTFLPTWSSLPYSGSGQQTVLSSMQPPPLSVPQSSTAIIATASATPSGPNSSAGESLPSNAQTSPASSIDALIPIPSYTSGDNLTSMEGTVYSYRRDTALAGTTIQAAVPGVRKRQNPDQYRPLFDCLEQCDGTPACVAVTLLGQSCLLYSAVESTTSLLGAQAAFNVERFTGYVEPAPPPYTNTVTSDTLPSIIPYSPPVLTSTGGPAVVTSPESPAPSASGIDSAPPGSSPAESISEAYSTPALSTDHATTFVPPPAPTSIFSTVLPVTLSIPSSLATSVPEMASSSELPISSSNRPAYSSGPGQASSSRVSSRSESPLVSATQSDMRSSTYALSSSPEIATSSTVLSNPSVSEQYPSATDQPGSSTVMSQETIEATLSSSKVASFSPPVSAASTDVVVPPGTAQGSQTASSYIDLPPVYESSSVMPGDSTTSMSSSTSTAIPLSSSGVSEAPAYEQGTTLSSAMVISSSSSLAQSLLAISSGASSLAGSSSSSSSSSSPSASSSALPGVSSVPIPSTPAAYVSTTSSLSPMRTSTTSTSSLRSFTASVSSLAGSSSSRSSASSSAAAASSSMSSIRLSSTSSSPSSSRSSSGSSSSSARPTSSSSSTARPSSSPTSAIPSATPVRNTGKRGLCYTDDLLTYGYSLSGQNSQVSWGYNYYYQNQTGTNSPGINPALDFVPLLFNDSPDLMAKWPAYAQTAIDNGADSLLGFNEPDLCYPGSACMTVNQSVIAWKQAMEPFAGKARLGAPAVTNGGPPSSLQWLGEFMSNCTGCTIDFVPIHWYANVYAFSYLQYYVQLAYNVTGKPIWITEFGIDSSGGSEAQYQAFLQMALPWLDAVPYVERYAWFYDGPGYLINSNGSGLSAQGMIYNSYTAPCPNWQNSAGHC